MEIFYIIAIFLALIIFKYAISLFSNNMCKALFVVAFLQVYFIIKNLTGYQPYARELGHFVFGTNIAIFCICLGLAIYLNRKGKNTSAEDEIDRL